MAEELGAVSRPGSLELRLMLERQRAERLAKALREIATIDDSTVDGAVEHGLSRCGVIARAALEDTGNG